MHQGTSDVGFVAFKDKFPHHAALLPCAQPWQPWQHLCWRRVLYSDNEIVLNSAKVALVLKDVDMYHTNSCEYEPWQNRPSATCA
eukprot:6175030-Pleurochrysis_carterae.AAC.1